MTGPIPIRVYDPLKTAWFQTSDLGNAQRIEVIADGRLLWIEDAQSWAFYDGQRWAIERGNLEAQRLAHRVIEHVRMEAEALGEIAEDIIQLKARVGDWCTAEIAQKRVETLLAHAVRSGSAGMTSGMLKQARSLLSAQLDEFDLDPLAYNVGNGTLRFFRVADGPDGNDADSGRWRVRLDPHEPTDRLMQLGNVEYHHGADCPFWTARLELLTPDAEQLAAFPLLYGYTLTGLTSDQAFYVHQGKGGDGKSATHMALADLHGDYYRHAGVKTFLQGKDGGGAEHRSDLVRLKGDVRFITCDEPKARSIWDGEIIKQITGSMVTARGANERTEVTFKPRGKVHVECNVVPRAPSDDKGFRRRMKLYQHKVSLADLPEGEMPLDLVLEKLAAEKPGILNWLIAGCLDWLTTRRIPQPSAMADVLADFWADSSPLLEWMGEWCDTDDPNVRTPAKTLWNHFKGWCEERGIEPGTETKFGSTLRDKQFPGKKDAKGVRERQGIRLRPQGMFASQPAPHAGSRAAGSFGADAQRPAGPAVDDDDGPDAFDPDMP